MLFRRDLDSLRLTLVYLHILCNFRQSFKPVKPIFRRMFSKVSIFCVVWIYSRKDKRHFLRKIWSPGTVAVISEWISDFSFYLRQRLILTMINDSMSNTFLCLHLCSNLWVGLKSKFCFATITRRNFVPFSRKRLPKSNENFCENKNFHKNIHIFLLREKYTNHFSFQPFSDSAAWCQRYPYSTDNAQPFNAETIQYSTMVLAPGYCNKTKKVCGLHTLLGVPERRNILYNRVGRYWN
jgi:hypothetical protein